MLDIFIKVVFVELNRGESQRYLDEMKSALRSISNLSSNRESSPFSRGSPVQSFTSHPPENQGGLAGSCLFSLCILFFVFLFSLFSLFLCVCVCVIALVHACVGMGVLYGYYSDYLSFFLSVYEANWQSLQSSVPLSNNRYQMPLQVS